MTERSVFAYPDNITPIPDAGGRIELRNRLLSIW
jgi:hypothetical protein